MSLKLQNFIPIPFSGCHLWLGSTDKDGYGTIGRVDGAHLKAHRESYREEVGSIPEGMQVLHKCDIPCCINKDHLYLGNPARNGLDKKERGRARTGDHNGEKNAAARFTVIDVLEIRNLAEGGMKQREIAALFETSQPAISKIVRRERWKDV